MKPLHSGSSTGQQNKKLMHITARLPINLETGLTVYETTNKHCQTKAKTQRQKRTNKNRILDNCETRIIFYIFPLLTVWQHRRRGPTRPGLHDRKNLVFLQCGVPADLPVRHRWGRGCHEGLGVAQPGEVSK